MSGAEGVAVCFEGEGIGHLPPKKRIWSSFLLLQFVVPRLRRTQARPVTRGLTALIRPAFIVCAAE